ncbi:AAA family ATPase [Photobacterium toruni]|uniref:AAA family ATPase n=1 Tax=Photobacterium toruni TaxID=1935446 RepID=UPI00210FC3B2|nr:Lon protease family protein [Photobacterium toruni]
MHEESWRNMFPDYSPYQHVLDQYDDLEPTLVGILQSRLSDAIRRFTAMNLQPRILRITASDNTLYRDYIIELLKKSINKSNDNNEKSVEQPIIIAGDNVTHEKLFGAVYPAKNGETQPQLKYGLLHQAHNGYLVLSITAILSDPSLWPQLKNVLMNGQLEWQPITNKSLYEIPSAETVNVKLIIIGERYLMAELDTAEPDLGDGMAMYGEFEQDLLLNEAAMTDYIRYVKGISHYYGLPMLANSEAIHTLLLTGACHAEDQTRLPLCPLWHLNLLSEASVESEGNPITAEHLKASLRAKEYRESYLPERAIADIHHGQVLIATEGEEVGQVNGLTVVEMPGHPMAYGEPARISCVVHFGDGDITDVERKVELGGNIHAKGMMIMQAFVATALDLDQALPYSASIVFEQSYSEVDGDSASLAELCALMSALSSQPINQEIAVTGAVDQFGRVQAVGGINQKIEGFYKVCVHRGLTGNQGVILPHTNLSSLCLNDEVIEAIKAKQFHIWAVNDVDEAIPLLTGKVFRSENEDDETILSLIEERIDYFHHGDLSNEIGIVNRLRLMISNWLGQN